MATSALVAAAQAFAMATNTANNTHKTSPAMHEHHTSVSPGSANDSVFADDADLLQDDSDDKDFSSYGGFAGAGGYDDDSLVYPGGIALGGGEGGGATQDGGASGAAGGPKRRGRRPPSTAAKRATHNAVERARRESLNGRFLELASVLPTMAKVKRPSKHGIVEKALDYVIAVQERERAILAENADLLSELNSLQAQLGLPQRAARVFEDIVDVVEKANAEKAASEKASTSPAAASTGSSTGATGSAAVAASASVVATVAKAGNAPRDGVSPKATSGDSPAAVRSGISPRAMPATVVAQPATAPARFDAHPAPSTMQAEQHAAYLANVGSSAFEYPVGSRGVDNYLASLSAFGFPPSSVTSAAFSTIAPPAITANATTSGTVGTGNNTTIDQLFAAQHPTFSGSAPALSLYAFASAQQQHAMQQQQQQQQPQHWNPSAASYAQAPAAMAYHGGAGTFAPQPPYLYAV